ncbi:MAG: hypothetical protein LBM38_05580 [Clostridiales bacterium]|jgi:nucleoside 2-deoxyribosyltransferase|nr:hypothetical protein [Clostridiales bacterium]
MAKRVFISFAVEDKNLRDLLVGQARNENSPFEFIDMSVKKPWDSQWKTNCRTKIKSCDGLLAIVTSNTKNADGQLWEIGCAKDEGIPRRGIWGSTNDNKTSNDISGLYITNWTWDNIKNWIESL